MLNYEETAAVMVPFASITYIEKGQASAFIDSDGKWADRGYILLHLNNGDTCQIEQPESFLKAYREWLKQDEVTTISLE